MYPQKELKGLGGWLVLFQIEIWSNLAGAVQMGILLMALGLVSKSPVFSEFGANPFEFFYGLNSPIAYALIAAIFVLMLLCVIFFYKKKMVFRVFFILGSVVYIVAMGLYYFIFMGNMYSAMDFGLQAFGGVGTFFMLAFGMLPTVGIIVAIIIALFKSKRVKNTFSQNV